jgi:glyoxylase-like metal-dependent hydrolase (beta-lactamase superfamily II)
MDTAFPGMAGEIRAAAERILGGPPATILLTHGMLARPPSPATVDWPEAWRSIRKLAALAPWAIGAGHGLPIAGPGRPESCARSPPPHR